MPPMLSIRSEGKPSQLQVRGEFQEAACDACSGVTAGFLFAL